MLLFWSLYGIYRILFEQAFAQKIFAETAEGAKVEVYCSGLLSCLQTLRNEASEGLGSKRL